MEEYNSELNSGTSYGSGTDSGTESGIQSGSVYDSGNDSHVVYTESSIPEETLTQIAEMHTVAVIGLALFGTLFFIIAFDIIYKKLSRFF